MSRLLIISTKGKVFLSLFKKNRVQLKKNQNDSRSRNTLWRLRRLRGQGRAQILKGWLPISEHAVLLDELKQAFKLVPDTVGPSQMNLKGLRESNPLRTEVAFEAFDVGVAVGSVMQEV